MAPPVELKTTFAPCRRAASSTRIVPSTFTSASKSGRATETRTSACAARWKTISGRAVSNTGSASARMSPTWSVARSSTFSRLPEDRSSSTCTSSPRSSSASTRFEPMNPAPPVTIARIRRLLCRFVFVTFEGLDGSGKSTQAELLARALERAGRDVVLTREPGGTPLGERLRELLLSGEDMTAWPEAALFAAAPAELVERVIRPALARGVDVVCDRYLDSSLAYQGIARRLGVDRVLELNLQATRGLLPDRTFLLLVDLDTARTRRAAEGDRIEGEGDD